MSGVFGPLPCTDSRVWSALCLRISFHGTPLGASPLTSSLARKASDWALGSIIPKPPLDIRRVRESHFTLAYALVALPPEMKLQTTPWI
jgi:hypothetical protein